MKLETAKKIQKELKEKLKYFVNICSDDFKGNLKEYFIILGSYYNISKILQINEILNNYNDGFILTIEYNKICIM